MGATSELFRNCSDTATFTTTQIYTHVLNRGPAGVRSPIDTMLGA